MARARNIKPSFFTNEQLAECSIEARLLFVGLWTLADREGRLEDRPKKIRAEVFPYDLCDCEPLLAELHKHGFIVRYQVDGSRYIQIPNFLKHQHPHKQEKASSIPAPTLTLLDEGVAITGQSSGGGFPAGDDDSLKNPNENANAEPAQKLQEPAQKLQDGVGLNPESPLLNPESGIMNVGNSRSHLFPAASSDPPKIPKSLDTPAFRESFVKWESYLRERGDVVVTSSGLEADLCELASHPVEEAIAMIQFTRRRKAKGLITDGSHRSRASPASSGFGKKTAAEKYKERFGDK